MPSSVGFYMNERLYINAVASLYCPTMPALLLTQTSIWHCDYLHYRLNASTTITPFLCFHLEQAV